MIRDGLLVRWFFKVMGGAIVGRVPLHSPSMERIPEAEIIDIIAPSRESTDA